MPATTTRPRRPTTTTIPIQRSYNNTISRATLSSSTASKPTSTIYNSSPTRSSLLYSSSPTLSLPPRQQSFVNRSTINPLPDRSTTTISNYSNAYNQGANSSNNRPVSSSSAYQNTNVTTGVNPYRSSLLIRQPSEPLYTNSTSTTKPYELTREYQIPMSPMRTVKFVPSSYNRYHH